MTSSLFYLDLTQAVLPTLILYSAIVTVILSPIVYLIDEEINYRRMK
jgi:hypothetical protein